MRPWKSIMAIVVLMLTTAATGSARAHHREWHDRGHGAHSHSQYVAPQSHSNLYFGFSVGVPAYVYEPAPYYYAPPARYYQPEPTYYYYDAPTWPPNVIYTD